MKDLMRLIEQESYHVSDPVTDFLQCLYTNYDFDGAQQKLQECEQVGLRSQAQKGFVLFIESLLSLCLLMVGAHCCSDIGSAYVSGHSNTGGICALLHLIVIHAH